MFGIVELLAGRGEDWKWRIEIEVVCWFFGAAFATSKMKITFLRLDLKIATGVKREFNFVRLNIASSVDILEIIANLKLKRTFFFFQFFFEYIQNRILDFSKKKGNTRGEVSLLNIYINLTSRFGFQYLSRGKEAISPDKRRTDYSRQRGEEDAITGKDFPPSFLRNWTFVVSPYRLASLTFGQIPFRNFDPSSPPLLSHFSSSILQQPLTLSNTIESY